MLPRRFRVLGCCASCGSGRLAIGVLMQVTALSANGFANETGRDGGDGARHRRRPARPSSGQRDVPGRRRRGDARRMSDNPEVTGSNPAPATSFRRSRPFPGEERAFCVSRTVARRVAATGLRAAWRRDGGDGVARNETAWTWWTLPPAIAGCPAQGYHRHPSVSSSSRWTSQNAEP